MKTSLLRCFAAAIAAGVLSFAGTARANIVSIDTVLTATSPTFNRPLAGTPPTTLSAVGTAVPYTVLPFTVSAATSFTLTTTAATLTYTTPDDTYLFLYSGSFNPAAPLTNALIGDDDGAPTGGLSSFTINLTAGTQYYAVITTYANASYGSITTSFNAASATLNITAVPEPSTYALLGASLAGITAVAIRRRYSKPANV